MFVFLFEASFFFIIPHLPKPSILHCPRLLNLSFPPPKYYFPSTKDHFIHHNYPCLLSTFFHKCSPLPSRLGFSQTIGYYLFHLFPCQTCISDVPASRWEHPNERLLVLTSCPRGTCEVCFKRAKKDA